MKPIFDELIATGVVDWALRRDMKGVGRPRKVDLRGVVEGLLYILRTACPWRLLPHDFPNRSTVQRSFYAWQTDGLWERINFVLLQQARERAGEKPAPRAG
jgi:putative transposase